jgi:hypothetical protein
VDRDRGGIRAVMKIKPADAATTPIILAAALLVGLVAATPFAARRVRRAATRAA